MDFIINFFSNNFQNCVWLAVLLVAMCPTLESKIAIPFAMNFSIWGTNALSPVATFFISYLGSLLPCYLIIFLTKKIKKKTSGFVIDKFFKKYIYKSQNIEKHKNKLSQYLLLTAFVSVPLPLTGVWTGSFIAGISNLNTFFSFLSICIGNLISTLSIMILCLLFESSIPYIFMISLIIIIVFMLIDLIFTITKTSLNKKSH